MPNAGDLGYNASDPRWNNNDKKNKKSFTALDKIKDKKLNDPEYLKKERERKRELDKEKSRQQRQNKAGLPIDSITDDINLNMPDIVYVYSQNSASSLLKFIKFNQSETLWMNTNLMCIGEKTSAILNEIKWKKIFLFNPGEEEFLLYKI